MNKNNKNKNKKNKKNKIINTIAGNVFIWIFIVVAAITIANNFSPFEKSKEISYTEYQTFLDQGLIESAEITGRTFKGKFSIPQIISDELGNEDTYAYMSTVLPEVSLEMTADWNIIEIIYEFKDVTMSAFDYLIQFSPWLLIILFWFFIMRRMQGG